MQVFIKKLTENAVIPKYAKANDAGMDMWATSSQLYNDGDVDFIEYGTGLAFEIPEGYFGMCVPRSSASLKNLILSNHVGILDSGYRGELKFRYKVLDRSKPFLIGNLYKVGERIGQIIILPYPKIEFIEAAELAESERGANGYGSTGK